MEIAFNSHYSDVFVVANSNACFYRLVVEGYGSKSQTISPEIFLTKDSDVNSDVRVHRPVVLLLVYIILK